MPSPASWVSGGDVVFLTDQLNNGKFDFIIVPREIGERQVGSRDIANTVNLAGKASSESAPASPKIPPSAINASSQHPPQVAAVLPPAASPILPQITVPPTLATTAETVDISGNVGGSGRIVSLKVDGSDAHFNADGVFKFPRAVPIGESVIQLKATDEWGQNVEVSIKVTRSLLETASAAFSPLNPDLMHARANPKAVALIIGVERYKNAPPAEFAEKDAGQFYDYAVHALGIPQDRIKLMTGNDAGNLDIEKALRTWVKPLVVKEQSDVFVFFSGHGLASEDGKDLYLLPYDADLDLLDKSAIRRQELIQMAVDAGAKSATFFLDTCYSGGTRGAATLVASARPILIAAKQQDVPPNVTILAAAGNDQLSSSLTQVRHGLFSYFLMKGLEGDAAGADHTITASKLQAYLAEHVPSEAAKLGRTQTPQLVGDGERVISAW